MDIAARTIAAGRTKAAEFAKVIAVETFAPESAATSLTVQTVSVSPISTL